MRLVLAAVLVALAVGVSSAGGARTGCNANTAWQDRYPVWSPTGDWIAFLRQLPGCDPAPQTLWIVHPNGTGARAVTTVRTWVPSWSPDGRRLVFETARGVEIASINRPGRMRLLAPHSVAPSWSPVDDRIAYRGGFGDLVVVSADGQHARTVAPMTIDFTPVAWSPEGSTLAYSVDTSKTNTSSHIEIVNADGTDRRRLTEPLPPNPDRQITDRKPVWNQWGDTIAFESNRDGNWEIYSVRADGTGLRNLTENPAEDIRPAWSPGSDQLAFISDRNEIAAPWGFRHSLYVLELPSQRLSRLEYDVHPDSDVSWSPRGATMAFSGGRECDRWGLYTYGVLESVRRTNRCVFNGTPRADTIVGSAFSDVINGERGNDRLYGGAGADSITGGPGADLIVGGPGADSLEGGWQRNVILGGPGNDIVTAIGGFKDVVDCGPGRDTVSADRFDVLRNCEVRRG